jgi:quercetin dioxygenase-like cupin family protein
MIETLAQTKVGEVGTLLAGIAAVLTILWSIGMCIVGKWFSRLNLTVSATVLKYVKRHLEESISGRDPATYYTLEVHFQGSGISLIAPMIPNEAVMIAENLEISVIDHSTDATTLALRAKGDAYLPPHWHDHTSELIEVRKGTITHLESGRIYRAQEFWFIPTGEPHSAVFSRDCFALVTHRPPLPTAKERPVNLDRIEDAFRELPHP